MNNKEVADGIYAKHLALASINGRDFRKTVMDEIQLVTGCSLPASATYYNNAKKARAPIAGLGRAIVPKTVRKMGKGKAQDMLVDDDDCFTVIELLSAQDGSVVGRCQSFILQGEASETFDTKVETWPKSNWVMIKGLGPNHGDTFKLSPEEKEIKRHDATV